MVTYETLQLDAAVEAAGADPDVGLWRTVSAFPDVETPVTEGVQPGTGCVV